MASSIFISTKVRNFAELAPNIGFSEFDFYDHYMSMFEVSGKSLENYFDEDMKESGNYTRLGYWHDRKGENEIDIVAEDELDNRIEFIEVKRQAKNFDEQILKDKYELFFKSVGAFKGYDIVYRGLSIEDM